MGLLRERASDSAERTSQILVVAGFEIRGREESMAVVVVRRVRVIILGFITINIYVFIVVLEAIISVPLRRISSTRQARPRLASAAEKVKKTSIDEMSGSLVMDRARG